MFWRTLTHWNTEESGTIFFKKVIFQRNCLIGECEGAILNYLYVKQSTCPHCTEIGNYCKGFLTWVWALGWLGDHDKLGCLFLKEILVQS